MAAESFSGTCFCGAVEIQAAGAPVAMGYCHCDSCRRWSAAPVNAFTLWKPSDVRVTKGESLLDEFNKTERSFRKFCKQCGGHVLTAHPGFDLVDVYAALLPRLKFEPAVHVNYAERVLRIFDGLPKFKDMPEDMGGSGETLPE